MKKLLGQPIVTVGRKRAGFSVWQREHKAFMYEMMEKQRKELEQNGEEIPAAMSLRQEVVKAEFAKLTAEQQANWDARAEREQEQCVELAAAANQANAIKRFSTWILPILEEAMAITGLHMSVFAGGPIPDGKMNIISVHAGRTMGVPGESFGTAYRGAIQQSVLPPFMEYLTKCFSPDDCKAIAAGLSACLEKKYKAHTQIEVDRVESSTSTLPTVDRPEFCE
ncbi:SERTA domain-containing protein 3 [Marasmius crinis-equi]|uniref:SERTA domain-containing protein 3 n=1 Tax=Marasmius crinis-equi TaxID=585013 RepID=A0ABR3EY30_9AGAR